MYSDNNLDDYFATTAPQIADIKALTDEEFIFNLKRYHRIEDHIFFRHFNVSKIMESEYVRSPYSTSAFMIEAVRRAKSRDNVRKELSSKLAKASSIVLTCANLIVTEPTGVVPLQIARGTVVISPEVNADDRVDHGVRALVQMFKPEKSKTGPGFIPVLTDDKCVLYPRPTCNLPAMVTTAYSRATTAEMVPVEIMKSINAGNTPKRRLQARILAPHILSSCVGSPTIKNLTKAWVEATPQELSIYKKNEIQNVVVAPGYAPFPVSNNASTVESAYNYLIKSRLVRGSDNKGLAFNTSSYYYGDLPSSWLRAVSTAHNMVYAFTELKKHLDVSAMFYNSDITSFNSAYEIVALNIPLSSVTTKNARISELGDKFEGVGWAPLKSGREYVYPLYIERTVAMTKQGLQFNPDFRTLMSEVSVARKQMDDLAMNYKIKFHYVLYTKACPDLLKRKAMIESVQAHNGSAWFLIVNDIKSGAGTTQATRFATRLARANAWKNYYPFHRIPFVKFDLVPDFSLHLKRGGVMTPAKLTLMDEFIASDSKTLNDEAFAENLKFAVEMDEAIESSKRASIALHVREKFVPETNMQDFDDMGIEGDVAPDEQEEESAEADVAFPVDTTGY